MLPYLLDMYTFANCKSSAPHNHKLTEAPNQNLHNNAVQAHFDPLEPLERLVNTFSMHVSLIFNANDVCIVKLKQLFTLRFQYLSRLYSTQATSRLVAIGDRVSLHMEGKLSGGDPLPKTQESFPLKFIVGSGQILPGVEKAVQGMTKGESKTVNIEPADAFGVNNQILTVPLKEMNLPEKEREMLALGQILELAGGERARVVKLMDNTMDIDLAHSYAGQSLTVTLELVDHELHEELHENERLVLPQVIEDGDKVTFPQRGDTMILHYTGKLAKHGKVFDSSHDRNQPFQFQIGVGQVIRGWDEGVMRMSKGTKAILNIPSAKGYGKAGAGGVIPPDADLIFEVELLDIVRC